MLPYSQTALNAKIDSIAFGHATEGGEAVPWAEMTEHHRPMVDSLFQRAGVMDWASCISTCGPVIRALIWVYRSNAGPDLSITKSVA